MCWCYQLLSGFLANGHLYQMSRQLANGKGDDEKKPGLCTDFLAFTLRRGKPQVRDRLMKVVPHQSSPQMDQ
jgi:hypothetical protein